MISKMTKLHLGIPSTERAALLRWLQDEQILHLVRLSTKKTVAQAPQSDTVLKLAQVQFALEFINRVKDESNIKKRRSLRNLFAGKPLASLSQLEAVLESGKLPELLTAIRADSDKLAALSARRQKLQSEKTELLPWQALKITGQALKGLAHTEVLLASVALPDEMRVKRALDRIPAASWQEISRTGDKRRGTIYLEVVSHRDSAEKLRTALSKSNAEIVMLQLPLQKQPISRLQNIAEELLEVESRYQQILKAARKFLKRERDLKMAHDGLLHRQEQEEVQTKMAQFDYASVIAGWIPEEKRGYFTEQLAAEFPTVAVSLAPTGKQEIPPVALKNNRLFRPFEAVTNIYGQPKYSELDPSPILSIFFLIAFGLALTDAGYGIVLMIATSVGLKYFRLKRPLKNMMQLFFYAGVATLIMGILTGGWFGLALEDLNPSAPRDALLALKIVDPISNPITILLVSLLFGVVQLLFAWGVAAYDAWRKQKYLVALFDNVAWITMVLFVLTWAGVRQGLLSEGLRLPALVLLSLNALLLVATQGRQHTNILLRIGAGVLSLYGLMGFLSDTLSYSRLLALGLATSIIGLVVNLIAGMVAGAVPVVGVVLAVVILVAGHTFNLTINALGAFIHAGRLQFVEFFPKFLEGGGTPYRPFGRVGKYVDNPKEFV